MTDNRRNKVEVRNLCKNYGDLEVLKNCSFDVREGEFICVVGPTGCGKTTFLNLLTCLISPTSGEILIDGVEADPKKHNLAFVFQEPTAYPWLTVRDNLGFAMSLKKKSKDHIEKKVGEIAKLMGLEPELDKFPHELASSAEQKVVIGRAFAMEPDLLLMDEPYSQMDIKTRFYLEDEVIRLWKELGSTVLFITHNIEEAVYLADRILILSQKPAAVKEVVEIHMPRPRDISSPEFIKIRSDVTDMIKWW